MSHELSACPRRAFAWWPLAIAGAALLLALISIYTSYQQLVRPSPFAWSAEIYPPSRTTLCPGEVFTYTSTLTVTFTATRPNDVLWAARHTDWVTVAGPYARGADGGSFSSAVERHPWYHSASFATTATVRVPALRPGQYYYAISAVTDYRETSSVRVGPIIVPPTCPAAAVAPAAARKDEP